MTYLECKKVLRRRIHDVANLKAMERNNGVLIKLDRVHIEGTGHAIFKNTTALSTAFTFFSLGRRAQDGFELLTEVTKQESCLINMTSYHLLYF